MEDLKQQTKRFALDTILFVEHLPSNETCRVLGKQLLRSGTSVGANYRAARRARASAAFIYKIGIVEEEADESAFWIDLLVESGHVQPEASSSLMREANELTAIAVSSASTARKHQKR